MDFDGNQMSELGAIQEMEETLYMLEEVTADIGDRRRCWHNWNRKYVLLCGLCGFSSLLLGIFYLTIYLVLRSYTSSLEYFQTLPTYVPAAALMITGLLVLTFMRRKHRNSILIKIVGFLCLVCAVLCVIVTVTTTVLHMNRLQTLRECTFYTQLHSCTCLPFTDEEPFELKLGVHISNCDVIHGPLYSCLRAMFGVSVIGILVSIFSCMLVYQLLSHEKKKMYWEQLENRRRFLYRRSNGHASNYNCCDEYGFASPAEIYPWRVWDSMDERYWQTNNNLYSPAGDESSTTSRSVLLTSNTPTGTPSLLLPWGGIWRNSHPYANGSQRTDLPTPQDSNNVPVDAENTQSDESRAQNTGVVLRPFIPRGLEARFGLRRHPLPVPQAQSRRPISDPGVTFQLSRYPPPFSEGFLPPLPYEGLDAFSRLMWDPPPPYSQPNSQENIPSIANISQSPVPIRDANHALQILSTPLRRPQGFSNFRSGSSAPNSAISSPTETNSQSRSPLHLALLKNGFRSMDGTGSLPMNNRVRCLPLGHVKSLDDVTEATRESLEALFGDSKEISSLNKIASHGDIAPKVLSLKSRHLRNLESQRVFSKAEQESELYFADVSSCTSIKQDKGENEYFDASIGKGDSTFPQVNHHYEQVNSNQREDVETNSNHNSDDTVIVHNSSSDHSFGMEPDNIYSVISPSTDLSSASPMATDTDIYSSYQNSTNSNPSISTSNLNIVQSPKLVQQKKTHPGNYPKPGRTCNDNEVDRLEQERRYETMSIVTETSRPGLCFSNPSDFNGNVSVSSDLPQEATLIQASTNDISFATRRPVPLSHDAIPESLNQSSDGSRSVDKVNVDSPERRLQSVQERLFSLKSVNV